MQVLVFVTDDGSSAGSGPILFLPDHPGAALPTHPRSLEWRYFATVSDKDALLTQDGDAALNALAMKGHFIAQRMIV